ncbi:hypothetical protein PN498_11285 [Oscillatoria sp. CS-180]|uniref:photosystem II assembly protein Psb35 n=1 Tax=Oscillatoria sp. CS-180 TaxID=3021720 RepID=UPI002330011D|nr:hypothetical protein [Oscillatoria sp. CS-180]MDB9526575.1 hypothetical protein [Oscillatoria sp. CS-180]
MFRLLTLADVGYTAALNSTLVLLLVGGFIAAVTAGSIAWYNSKKPAGWEDAQKPDWVPDVNKNVEPQKTETER